MKTKEQATRLLHEFKGDRYAFGPGCLAQLGPMAAQIGRRVSLVVNSLEKAWAAPILAEARDHLSASGVDLAGDPIPGARPNAPREDVLRIAGELASQSPEAVISIGAGSGIDAVKGALAHLAIQGRLDDYFGVGQVTALLQTAGTQLLPHLACMVTASSAAHLTKYSNITRLETGQKMLIVDEAIVPSRAVFDYNFSRSQPQSLTMDGALDGIAHCLEVYMGIPSSQLDRAEPVCLLGIEMIVRNIRRALEDPGDLAAREQLGLATDLGGYAIMIGGTNGAHLNSFSLVNLLSHGRACALMNPYYVVFFSPAIEPRLRKVAAIYREAGYAGAEIERLSGRALGEALAEAMLALSRDIGFPTCLAEVDGFADADLDRCLEAAKNPALESKLKNMPVPLTASLVDEYMGAVLKAARNGDFSEIRNLPI